MNNKKLFSLILYILIISVFVSLNKNTFFYQNNDRNGKNIFLQLIPFEKLINSNQTINCRKSAKFIVTTTLCVHDLMKDQFVSKAIWTKGVYEPELIEIFTNYIQNRQDLIVFDIGAQVGQFTLFAAKIGRRVVSVEPFYESVLRIDKAARIEGIRNRITILNNAISNKREHKQLSFVPKNIGGQSLLNSGSERTDNLNSVDNFMIKTVLFDDLIEIIPKQQSGEDFKRGIIKIDIEGYEPYAFEKAKELFKKIKIELIFMEWNIIRSNRHEYLEKIENMISFLSSQGLVPLGNRKQILDSSSWEKWPNKFYWLDEKIFRKRN